MDENDDGLDEIQREQRAIDLEYERRDIDAFERDWANRDD